MTPDIIYLSYRKNEINYKKITCRGLRKMSLTNFLKELNFIKLQCYKHKGNVYISDNERVVATVSLHHEYCFGTCFDDFKQLTLPQKQILCTLLKNFSSTPLTNR